jgi:cytochrome P450
MQPSARSDHPAAAPVQPADPVRPSPPSPPSVVRTLDQLPGPRPWPLLGNLPQLRATRVHRDIEAWCLRHGPLFRIRFGRRAALVVADHALVSAVLRDRPDGFRRPLVAAQVSQEMGGLPGVFEAEGEDWRRQRRMVMAGFAPHAIKAYFTTLVTVAARLRTRWQDAARAGRPIVLADDLKRYTVDIIAGLAFGAEVDTLAGGDDVIQRHLDLVLPAIARRTIAFFPYWRYIKLPADRRLDRAMTTLRAEVAALVAAARTRMEAEPARRQHPSNLLEAMIAAADEGQYVDDERVGGNVLTMLLAGEDTTANTLAWMLYLLARHPACLRRLADEVRARAPDIAALGMAQLDGLDYLDACIDEAMRLKPVAPYIPVEALRATTIGDVRVEAGTLVWCVLRHDSVSDAHVAQAAAFMPERWLAQDGAAPLKGVALPFGAGLRTCPGRYLALLEIRIAMVMLLTAFDIVAVDTPDGHDAREHMAFVMSPEGLTMRLREAGA